MRFYKTRQLEMLRMVSNYLKKKQDELAAKVPVMKALIAEYNELFESVYKLEISGLKKTVVSTLKKKNVKDELIDATLKLVRVLRTYHYKPATGRTRPGEQKSNPAETVKYYTKSDLTRASAESLSKICKQVIGDTKKIKNLRIYGLFPEHISDAEAYLKEFAVVKHSPKLTKKEIAKRNNNVVDGIRECISFLENNIDPLVANATEGNPELNAGYFGRRKVLPRGPGAISDTEARYRRSRKPGKGKISSSETKSKSKPK